MGKLRRSRQLVGCCLGAALVIGVASTCVSAVEFAGGTGEPGDPYQIGTAEQLAAVGQDPNLLDKHFVLIEDIDLDPNAPGGRVFAQAVIAPDRNPDDDFQEPVFTGSFDGRGRAIKCLTIQGGSAKYVGLFGRLGKNARVRNLALERVAITSSAYCVAGLVGYNRGTIVDCNISGAISGGTGEWCNCLGLLAGKNWGRISRCDVDGSISGGSTERGGYFGLLTGLSRGMVSDCAATGTITAGINFHEMGGLIGDNYGSVADCHAACDISTSSKYAGTDNVGGLVGVNYGSINRCYATGSILCGNYSSRAGGLTGYSTGVIAGCYATGNVSGEYANNWFGGLAGMNAGNIALCWASGDVTGNLGIGGLVGQNESGVAQCYATGRTVADTKSWIPVGGLVAESYEGGVSRSFWDVETSGRTKSAGGTGLTTPQMQDREAFLAAGWDFVTEQANGTSDAWLMPEGGGYPLLSFFSEGYRAHRLEGAGTLEDPYQIATAEDLGAICHSDTTACYKLVADVNLAGVTWTAPVVPSFEGRFDGNGFTIANLSMQGDCFLGLFGVLSRDAVVENVEMEGAKIVAGSSASDISLLAVENWGRVADCRVAGEISGGSKPGKHGGLVEHNYGTISHCGPVDYSGPYTIVVTDPEEVRGFVGTDEMEIDEVWIPDTTDLENAASALRAYLDSDTPSQPDEWISREYILFDLRRYNREYSGFIKDGRKYVICQMHTFYDFDEEWGPPDNAFSSICDGGCGVVRFVFDTVAGAIVSIACNGVA